MKRIVQVVAVLLVVVLLLNAQAIVTGNSVTVIGSLPAGSALIGKVGIDQTTPGTTNAVALSTINTTAISTGNGTVDAGTMRVAIASNNTAFPVTATVNNTTCAGTKFSQNWVAVPTSTTLLSTAVTSCLLTISFSNTNSSAQTITLTDNTGTPINVVGPALSLPGLTVATFNFNGTPFNNGIKWFAGGTGVTGSAVWVQ